MKRALIAMGAAVFFVAIGAAQAQEKLYEPTWESLDKRPIPAWFDEAKFGIFIHFGVYAVPAWSPKGSYSEWYWHRLMGDLAKREKSGKIGPTLAFHLKAFGPNVKYQDFAPMFRMELFDPKQWADIFKRSGARYVVLTSKHHDGFCLWPSPQSWNWNSVDVGPHRDIIGELTDAVRAAGLRMGFYYSLYEWYNPLYRSDLKRYVAEHMMPQVKDLVTRYKPAVLWGDGEWEHTSAEWRTPELIAWLFNESPCKDYVVINDRWGKDTRSRHGGFYTSEYGKYHGKIGVEHKWEENRGMGASYGYNRNESIFEYKPARDLIHLLINVVSKGGNLLLDVGPTADGRIPVIMQERLLQIGEWLKVNGEAIYGTRPWRQTSEGNVRYTAKGDAVYAICLAWPGDELVLAAPKPGPNTKVTLVGWSEPLKWRSENGKMHIEVPQLPPNKVPCRYAYCFKLTGVK